MLRKVAILGYYSRSPQLVWPLRIKLWTSVFSKLRSVCLLVCFGAELAEVQSYSIQKIKHELYTTLPHLQHTQFNSHYLIELPLSGRSHQQSNVGSCCLYKH